MAEFLRVALTFPCVVYTVLLGAVLVYWLFVIAGAARIELLGEGGGDGLLEGHALADGASGHGAGHVLEHAAQGHVHEAGEPHAATEGPEGHGGLAGILGALKLRSAPLTVVVSMLTLFSWLICAVGVQLARARLPEGIASVVGLALFVVAPLLALGPTSLSVRPLAGVFRPKSAAARRELVGKLCTVRTGTVTDKFGEATLEDGGAGVVLRVRVDDQASPLQRGDRAIVVSYDETSHEFVVIKADELFDEPHAGSAS